MATVPLTNDNTQGDNGLGDSWVTQNGERQVTLSNMSIGGLSRISLTDSVQLGDTLFTLADGRLASTAGAGVTTYAPHTTKGDICVYDGTTQVRLPVGTKGQLLSADPAASAGVTWADASMYAAEARYAESPDARATTAPTYQTKLTLAASGLSGGAYMVHLAYLAQPQRSKTMSVRLTAGAQVLHEYATPLGELVTDWARVQLPQGDTTFVVAWRAVQASAATLSDVRLELYRPPAADVPAHAEADAPFATTARTYVPVLSMTAPAGGGEYTLRVSYKLSAGRSGRQVAARVVTGGTTLLSATAASVAPTLVVDWVRVLLADGATVGLDVTCVDATSALVADARMVLEQYAQ